MNRAPIGLLQPPVGMEEDEVMEASWFRSLNSWGGEASPTK